MKSRRILGAASVACGVALALAGSALADSNATIGTTGPNSTNTVEIDNSVQFSSTNLNLTSVDNVNGQQAVSGNVNESDNTQVGGGVGSGDASNNNMTTTAVTNNNPGVGQVVGVTTPGQGAAGGSTSGNQPQQSGGAGAGSGSVLGASTSAAPAILPVTGATVPVDVSALRAAWHAPSAAPTAAFVQKTQGLTTGMLALATLFSLLGGVGSVLYGRRNAGRV